MKTIVTHRSPDLDAITSSWLVHRFMPGWKNPQFEFVPTGKTLNDENPDDHPDIIHVDTGFGKFDHHQTSEETCAALRVFEYLVQNDCVKKGDIEPLERLVAVVNRYDHFKEVFLDEPDDDMFDFSLNYLIHGLRYKKQDDLEVLRTVEDLLDGLLVNLKNKVHADKALKKGFEFTSAWGKTLALESENDETLKLGFKQGYDMIVRKSINYGSVRIKLHPKIIYR